MIQEVRNLYFYNKENEYGIIWNDSDLNIKWPTDLPILSEKDNNNNTLSEFINEYKYIAKKKTSPSSPLSANTKMYELCGSLNQPKL